MRRWQLWVLWFLSLLLAPAGLFAIDLIYPDVPSPPRPWPQELSLPSRLADMLLTAHLVLSGVAAATVVPLTRRWYVWLLGWVGIGLWLAFMFLWSIEVQMAKSGTYL
jgi:hypothetical protein